MRNPFQSRVAALVFLGLLCLAVLLGATMIQRSSVMGIDGRRHYALFDDAMITMRYADNLVAGRGLVWNPGERVEGFSSPVWVFVEAAAIVLAGRETGVAAVQFFGLGLVLVDLVLVALLTGRLLRDSRHRDLGMLVAVLLTMTFYDLFYWSIMGMETGLVVPAFLSAIWLSLDDGLALGRRLAIAALLSLVALTRPEAVLLAAIYAASVALRRPNRTTAGQVLGQAVVFLLPIAGYQLFRRLYFGQWYANSYLLKLGGLGLFDRVRAGWRFSWPLLVWAGWLAVAVAAVLAWQRWRATGPRAWSLPYRGRLLEFLVAALVMVGYQILVGGDAWPLFTRFPAPAVVLLIVAFVVAVVRLFEAHAARGVWLDLAFAFVLLAMARFTLGIHREDFATLRPNLCEYAAPNVNAALLVKTLTRDNATIESFFAGVPPYYAERHAFDPLGRTDGVIARLPAHNDIPWGYQGSMPGHNKYDLAYSFKQLQPTAILVHAWGFCQWANQDLSSWCRENYHFVRWGDAQLLLRKDSPLVYWDRMRR